MDKAKTIPEYIEGLMQGIGRYEPRVIETEGPCPACGQDDCTEGCPRLNLSLSKDLGYFETMRRWLRDANVELNSLNNKDLGGGAWKSRCPPRGAGCLIVLCNSKCNKVLRYVKKILWITRSYH
jgi:hypothetical protein